MQRMYVGPAAATTSVSSTPSGTLTPSTASQPSVLLTMPRRWALNTPLASPRQLRPKPVGAWHVYSTVYSLFMCWFKCASHRIYAVCIHECASLYAHIVWLFNDRDVIILLLPHGPEVFRGGLQPRRVILRQRRAWEGRQQPLLLQRVGSHLLTQQGLFVYMCDDALWVRWCLLHFWFLR